MVRLETARPGSSARSTTNGCRSSKEAKLPADDYRLESHVTRGIKDFTIPTTLASAQTGQSVTYRFDGKFYKAK